MISDFGKLTSFERGTLLTKLFICLILVNVVVWVPNAPCGVESLFSVESKFLMHRVELKVHQLSNFLMHRVELKVVFESASLMHRVELKVELLALNAF
jgi:hypothetical protein